MQKRPTRNDDIVIDKVAERLLPHIVEWIKQDKDVDDTEFVLDDIKKH